MSEDSEMVDKASELSRDVFAHFGLAIYLSNCLEHGIVNAMVFADLIPNKALTVKSQQEWEETVDLFYTNQFEETFGKIINALKKTINIPENTADLLKKHCLKETISSIIFFVRTTSMPCQKRAKIKC